jgi:hypothetical protein
MAGLNLNLGKRFAIVSGLVVLVLVSVGGVLTALSVEDGRPEPRLSGDLIYVPLILLLAMVGGLIVFHRPGNRIGAALCLVGLLAAVLGAIDAYVKYDLYVEPGALPAINHAAWLGSWLWVFVLVPPITLLLLIAPDGRLPSPRWRPVLLLDLVVFLLLAIPQAFHSGPFEDFPTIENPLGLEAIDPLLDVMLWLGFLLLTVAIAASGAALFRRFGRSNGIERQQLKWLASAAAGAIGIFVISWMIGLASDFDVWSYSPVIATALLPLATGIAILRHNLYDIDRIINRTLVYVPLTAILAGIFVAVTGLIRTVFTDLTEAGSDAAIAFSTLAVVAVLTPVKNYLQAFVDSRFKQQHDPQKALKDLISEGRLVARVLDTDRYVEGILEEVTDAFELAGAAVALFGHEGVLPRVLGHAGESSPLSIPLVSSGGRIGTLQVWPQDERGLKEGDLIEALQEPADVLAQVVGVLPQPRRWPVTARDGGDGYLTGRTPAPEPPSDAPEATRTGDTLPGSTVAGS